MCNKVPKLKELIMQKSKFRITYFVLPDYSYEGINVFVAFTLIVADSGGTYCGYFIYVSAKPLIFPASIQNIALGNFFIFTLSFIINPNLLSNST